MVDAGSPLPLTGDQPPAAGPDTSVRWSDAVLVMTDLEGSTRRWVDDPVAMNHTMRRHHAIIHSAVANHGGWRPVDQGEGDAVFAAFDSAEAALLAVARFQRELDEEFRLSEWPVRVRVGVHVGEVISRDGNLFGPTVNRCARLRGLATGGQVLISATVTDLVREKLPADLTLTDLGEHRMKDLALPERVHQLNVAGLPDDFPKLVSLNRARHNLPVQTSTFFGRGREVSDLLELITTERLVTIVGFGGLGKTRLALQLAAELADGNGDGVWFIDLSGVRDPDEVPSLICSELGIPGAADGALPGLIADLKDRRLLLVLDNVEQLLPDVAVLVATLLRSAPGIRILATSRGPLRLNGEIEYALQPLPVPPAPRRYEAGTAWTAAGVSSLIEYDAVALFVARASAVRHSFMLSETNATAVAAICVRLDGLPLALELAAARSRVLSPEVLLSRLDHSLAVLTGGSRDLPVRQRTLRATIAWSYDGLDEGEQRLLDRLSVFPGTFTLDAAEQVGRDDLTAGQDIFDAVALLVERSLVRYHPATGGQADDRYSLLESIREFAAERLAAAGEGSTLADRHGAYYTGLVSLPPDWTSEDRARSRAAVRADLHNFRAALSYSRTAGTSEQEIRLAASVIYELTDLGLPAEARLITDHALGRSSAITTDRVYLLRHRHRVEFNADRLNDAWTWAARGVTEARQLGEPSLLVAAFAAAASSARSLTEVRALMAEAEPLVALLPPIGTYLPRWFIRLLWDDNPMPFFWADPARAEAAQRRRVAADPDLAFERVLLGNVLTARGQLTEAAELLEPFEGAEKPPIGDAWSLIAGSLNAAALRTIAGDFPAALADLDLADERLRGVEMPDRAVQAAYHRALVERAVGNTEDATRRLERALREAADDVEPLQLAHLRWLLSALRREAGDLPAAAQLLGEAWSAAAGWDGAYLDLVMVCLLERAVQRTDDAPDEAARLLGIVKPYWDTFTLQEARVYDVAELVIDLRVRLGADRVRSDHRAVRRATAP